MSCRACAPVLAIIEEIKSVHPSGITMRDLSPFERRYLNTVAPNPGDNWMSRMGWASWRIRKFRLILKEEGIKILQNPEISLHDYVLHQNGFKRISELEALIAVKKKRLQICEIWQIKNQLT